VAIADFIPQRALRPTHEDAVLFEPFGTAAKGQGLEYNEFGMWTRLLLTASIATAVLAQQDDPVELLRRVQARVAKSLERLPRYMCTETIDRSEYEPDVNRGAKCDEGRPQQATHLATSDRLRLDVGVGSTVEMYSWVGENRFDDRDLLDMVHEGAISTGSFAAFLTAVFRSGDATFTYDGETTNNGRTVVEFGFSVPYEKSRYFYGNGEHRVITAYSGTFLVDPKVSDLVQLSVRTSQLPAETSACYASTTLDYVRVSLGGSDFLLPSATRLRVLHTDGVRSENETAFSNCHEFVGESTIQFDLAPNAPATDATHGPVSQALSIPPGLRFRVGLSQGIDTVTAAAGDKIQGKLITPIKSGSTVLVATGAPVVAHIVRIRKFYGTAISVSLDITLESIEVRGVKLWLAVTPDKGNAFPKPKSGTLQQRVELGTLRGLEDRSASYTFRNVGLIPGNLESSWVTTAPDSHSTPAK
jgi:hypothetical protein